MVRCPRKRVNSNSSSTPVGTCGLRPDSAAPYTIGWHVIRQLLILDEIGYTPLKRSEATFLFEIVAKRYDRRKPIVVTSNKSWGAWGDILPDQVMTAAILDRLLHRSVTINIQGESYRLREHRKAGLVPASFHDPKGGDSPPSDVSNRNR